MQSEYKFMFAYTLSKPSLIREFSELSQVASPVKGRKTFEQKKKSAGTCKAKVLPTWWKPA